VRGVEVVERDVEAGEIGSLLGAHALDERLGRDAFLAGLDAFLTELGSATGNLGIPLAPINSAALNLKAQLESYKSTVAKVK
jgi:hypothetical protein